MFVPLSSADWFVFTQRWGVGQSIEAAHAE
jgi:hypothetical protein